MSRGSNDRLNGFSDHDVQLDGFRTTGQMNFLDHFESEFLIYLRVDAVAAFEIAKTVFSVGLDAFALEFGSQRC